MSDRGTSSSDARLTEQSVAEDLQRQPHLLMMLAENALTVAESLRDNYFRNTARFIAALRQAAIRYDNPIMQVGSVADADWSQVEREVVTFIDGGVGTAPISSQQPILLRVGSYSVRTGERSLAEREQFGYYPVILGDIEGTSKERTDFPDIVRMTAELLGGLAALDRTPNLDVLLFHGPLVNFMGAYAGHTPFTERDVDIFLRQYGPDPEIARQIKEEFLAQAYVEVYPRMTDSYEQWVERRLFEPLAWIAYLHRRLISEARSRSSVPLIAGVVERGRLREFSETVLLERVFRNMRAKGSGDYFNKMYGRSDLTSPAAILNKLGYHDALLLAMILQPGEYSEPWRISKDQELHRGEIALPGAPGKSVVDWGALRPSSPTGFPRVLGFYIHISPTTEPIRVELYEDLGRAQVAEVARRVYLYSRLLPGYGFPVGLDIADKYAHVPDWLLSAYSKLIRYHLGVSLQQGEISDAAMRRILVQAIYMTHRDWLFRPNTL
jgi:hypothetical protein